MTFSATPTVTASAATRSGPAALGLALMAALGVTALLSSGTNISSTSVASSSTKLARGANTPATAPSLAASDKTEHTQCLADQVETNDELYEGAVKTFLESHGQNYTKGGHFDGLLQAFKAAANDNSLDDVNYLKVATAKARVDGLVGYIMHLRTADACDKTTDDLAATELLFAVDEGKCMKSKAAIDAFKANEEGKALIAPCETTTPISTTTTLAPSFTVKTGDPCTTAFVDGRACVGRPGGYLPNEKCDIVVGGGGVLGPCPVFDIYDGGSKDALTLPGGAEYSGASCQYSSRGTACNPEYNANCPAGAPPACAAT
jgi:hypothetical protein